MKPDPTFLFPSRYCYCCYIPESLISLFNVDLLYLLQGDASDVREDVHLRSRRCLAAIHLHFMHLIFLTSRPNGPPHIQRIIATS